MHAARAYQTMGVVIGRVNAPLVARHRVLGELDAVCNQIIHVEVFVPHVHFHAQCGRTLRPHAPPHLLKQLQGLRHRAVAPRAAFIQQKGSAINIPSS